MTVNSRGARKSRTNSSVDIGLERTEVEVETKQRLPENTLYQEHEE
jgi:hypothetical protein